MKIKNKQEIIIIGVAIIIQTIVFIIAGINKSYIHMDEAYSLGLASYSQIDIQGNNDFFNKWHNNEYYEDYLTVNEDEKNEYLQVYENQKNDVHPPLYYLLLRIAMGFNINKYSKWPGIVLNIIIYVFITIFMYLIAKKILDGKNKCKEKAIIIALMSALTLSSINNAIYIRMYALSTLNIVITTYLHMKLLEGKSNNKLLILIGLSALIGSLTHYYYLFYLAMLFIMFVVKYIKEKRFKQLIKYVGTIILSAITSLLIFPYSIQHMFFGYRGQGAISKLTNISQFINNICQYIVKIDLYTFNNLLFLILFFIFGIIIYKKVKKIKIIEEKNKYIKYIALSTTFYAILVAISSPWVELRYIMPVCNFIFILIIYVMYILLENIVKEKTLNKIIIIIFLIMFIFPFITNQTINLVIGEKFRNEKESSYSSKEEIAQKLKEELKLPADIFLPFTDASMENILLFIKDYKIEPEVLYSNKNDITEIIEENKEIPALYIFNSSNNRFLDDILLFANIEESYIAKDIKCNKENIKKIMEGKDTKKGVLIFINDGQNNSKIIETISTSLELENKIYLKRLNACDVYLIKP